MCLVPSLPASWEAEFFLFSIFSAYFPIPFFLRFPSPPPKNAIVEMFCVYYLVTEATFVLRYLGNIGKLGTVYRKWSGKVVRYLYGYFTHDVFCFSFLSKHMQQMQALSSYSIEKLLFLGPAFVPRAAAG